MMVIHEGYAIAGQRGCIVNLWEVGVLGLLRQLFLALCGVFIAGCGSGDKARHTAGKVPAAPANMATLEVARSVLLPPGFDYPNGITYGPGGVLYVGSVISGDIVRIAADGAVEKVFTASADVFTGNALRFDPSTGLLWVASSDFLGLEVDGQRVRRPHRVAALDPERGTVVWSAAMPDGGFGNDIALDGAGGVFITDSLRAEVWHLAGPAAPFRSVAKDPAMGPGEIGPAGIARAPAGDLIVGLFSDGALLRISPAGGGAGSSSVTPIELSRPLENPDGIAFAADGRLLLLEGAVGSGDGRLVAVDLDSPAPHAVTTLLSGLHSPLNLSINGDLVALTEGGVRHLLSAQAGLVKPQVFRVLIVNLAQ